MRNELGKLIEKTKKNKKKQKQAESANKNWRLRWGWEEEVEEEEEEGEEEGEGSASERGENLTDFSRGSYKFWPGAAFFKKFMYTRYSHATRLYRVVFRSH
jgi:hypothetical protein